VLKDCTYRLKHYCPKENTGNTYKIFIGMLEKKGLLEKSNWGGNIKIVLHQVLIRYLQN
jgi:hypothetical protein